LSYWLIISLQDTVYLETGHLIENFVMIDIQPQIR